MVGSVLNETATALGNVDAFSMTNAQLVDKLTPTYGDKTAEVIAAYRAGHPGANPFQLGSIIATSRVHRQDALTQSQRKSGLHAAPAYNWWFQWQTPMLDGRPMAFHTADLAFFFDNAARCECATGNTPDAQHLAAQMADCWIAFAKTGNPNHPGIPHWDPVTPSGSETMIFDTTTRFSRDSDAAERKVIHEAVAARS
jgi:para-nitrobenzyl esterase